MDFDNNVMLVSVGVRGHRRDKWWWEKKIINGPAFVEELQLLQRITSAHRAVLAGKV